MTARAAPPTPLVVPGHCSAADHRQGLCGQAQAPLYACGWRCDEHAPWALAGRPRPQPGPGLPGSACAAPGAPCGPAADGQKRRAASRPPSGLLVDLGQWDNRGQQWLRYPTADYRCPYGCGFTESASGDSVPHFVARIRKDHRAQCPVLTTKQEEEPPNDRK